MSLLSLREIEQTLKSAVPQRRQETLRAVADMFLNQAPNLDDTKIEHFDDVLGVLLNDADQSELVQLSARMAPVENAPRRLIKRLAGDSDIAVAAPVLEQSPRLTTEDLCDIARSGSNSHLLVISGRKGLLEPLTDILINRGDQDVARTIAANETARISAAGVERLLEQAQSDQSLSERIRARADISPETMKAALARAAARQAGKAKAAEAAQATVSALKAAGQLDHAQISVFAKAGRYEDAVAAVALLANFKYDLIEGMLYPNRIGGIMLVCKAMGWPWCAVDDLLQMAADRNGLTSADIRASHREFLDLSRGTAERVVRFWRVRQTVTPLQG
jgi:uncharacterized protein (DUF2336 family)